MLHKILLIFAFIAPFLYSQETQIVAVMELKGTGIYQTEVTGISNRLRTELHKTEKFRVIERSEMDKIIEEQKLQLTGITSCNTNDCAIEVGQLLGAKFIIMGTINKVGKT
ncbi:MAG: hypothetical protein HQK83_05350 [Fibrobacteria bacterium]|nr:hypothetical protein [Fibrobacteria bacterium]